MKQMLIIKTIVLAVGITILTIIALSSCSAGRGLGCRATSGYVGYR